MSFLGPRPHRSPLETSSHSITPLAPSVMVTWPSDAWAAEGMKIPATRRRAAWTSGRRTICGKWGEPISSSPSATSTKLSGGFLPAARMACSAARKVASGPFWFTAPRPISTLPNPGRSTMAAAQGGDDHSAGSTCLTSYMKYRPSVRGAPASSVAKMPGWPSVGIFVTWSKPASLSMRMVSSQPSFTPRFSAAMDGCRIHSCRRATASSWRFSISVKIGARSSERRVGGALGQARAALAAAVRSRKVRRSTLMNGLRGLGVGEGARFNLAWRALLAEVPNAPQHMGDFRSAHRSGGFVVQRTSFVALALVALGAAGASGQERQITGRVTSATNGEAIAGVNVSVTGAAFAAITNADGRYTISAPSGALTLVFRRIAFKRREVSVPAGQNVADAALEADVFNLEAVVVTGQATGVERRNAAIAATSVSGQEVSAVPAPAVDRALAGRVPGAIISQNSGAPGGGTQIQIRGNNTVIGSPDPVFVVDGVIYSDASLPTGLYSVTQSGANRGSGPTQDDPVNRHAELNPNNIETTELLRGAAASSIYGSKAANGVVIIRTNRGKAGKPQASITQRMGFFELERGPATRVFSLTDTFPYTSATIASYMVAGQLPFYDHLQEIAGERPLSYETNLNVSGGAENTRYYLSGGVIHDPGIVLNTFNNRQTLRANLDQTLSGRLSLSVNTQFTRNQTDKGFTNNDNNGASVTYAIAYMPSFVNILPAGGTYPKPVLTYKGSNPLQSAALGTNDEGVNRFTGGATLTFQAVQTERHNLRLVGAGGIDLFDQRAEVISPPELYYEARLANPGTSTLANGHSRQWNWNVNAIHTYAPSSAAFKATTSAGVQVEDRELETSRATAHG